MVSRRRYLATVAAMVGLAGCGNRGDDTEPTETAPTVSTPSATELPPSQTPAPTTTAGPGPGPDETDTTPEPTPEPTETATPDPHADRFDTILDVTEAGIDPTGSEAIEGRLADLVDDDTLLRFPEGTYPLHSIEIEGVSNFGMVGDGAVLKPLTYGREMFLSFRQVSDLLVEGFRVDNSETNVAAWCDLKVTGGTNVLRDYVVEDFVDVNERTNGFTVMVEGKDTSLEIADVDISKGGVNGAATFVFPRREFFDPSREAGSLTFRNCVMNGWGKEGLYASPHEGPLRVIGGEYANNAIAQVRVGGGNAPEQAVVRDVTVRVDEVPDYMPEYNQLLRGIWLKEGDGALVENCDVTLANVGVGQTPGAIYVNDQFGRATIRDCTVTTENVSKPAFLIQEPVDEYEPDWMPSLDHLPPKWDVTIENVTIDGDSPNTEAIHVEGRSGVTFRDVTMEKTGQAADGILFDDVADCRLEGGSMTTERFPVVMRFDDGEHTDCAVHVSGTTMEGTSITDDGSQLPGEDDYCVGSGALSEGRHEDSNRLSLTRSEHENGTPTPGGSASAARSQEEYQLYGRWLS